MTFTSSSVLSKTCTIILFLVILKSGISQNSGSLELFFTPAMKELGSLNNRYSTINVDYIQSSFRQKPVFEAGALYRRNVTKTLGFLAGFSWRETERTIGLRVIEEKSKLRTLFDYHNNTYSRLLCLKFGTSIILNDKTRLNLVMNAEVFENTSTSGTFNRTSAVSASSSQNGESVQTQLNLIQVNTNESQRKWVPEINVYIDLTDNFSLNFGSRLRFWKSSELDHYAEISGFTGVENAGTNKILFKTEADKREISVFAGIVYRLKFKKDN